MLYEVITVRALEGELARTIMSIGTVKQARVHLVLPKREMFSRETQEPSASVILRVLGGRLGNVITSYSIHYTKLYDLNP